jgi:transcriptional regulator with XRE-family HTH domain
MSAAWPERPFVHRQARALLAQLQRLAAQAPGEQQPLWSRHQQHLEELAQLLESSETKPITHPIGSVVSLAQWIDFGQRLRDKRNAAGLSRQQLARRAKLSDATVKFLETARHPPSRSTLIRLIGVPELKLTWAEVPGQPAPPAPEPMEDRAATWSLPTATRGALNCFLAPGYDPLAQLSERTRLLQGAGGYLEQSCAYLEPASAAAYLALCQHSLAVTGLRSQLPLTAVAKRIEALHGPAKLQVLALGCGDGLLETQLVGHLLEVGAQPRELCLLDLSPALLTCAHRHAVERLSSHPSVFVWGLLGDFYRLPQYAALQAPSEPRGRRLYTMLGQTWAHLDHEPRFVQQSLVDSLPDDLLLLDLPLAQGPCHDRMELRRRDRLLSQGVPAAYAQWLQGPLLRHCPQAEQVQFNWQLEMYTPVPGSYALHAVATVQSSQRADRAFSVFRVGRYDAEPLAQCMESLGWYEVGAWVYGGEHALRLYCKGARATRAEAESSPGAETINVGPQ